MENPHLQRGIMLADQGRWDLAEGELRQGLAAAPDHSLGHAYLALCLAKKDQLDDAEAEAAAAIRSQPDSDFAHYAYASVRERRNDLDDALLSIGEAIRLNPFEPMYFAAKAHCHLGKKEWQTALDSAEHGLSIDPESVTCNNVRAMALVQLGRKAEAGQTLDAALARQPDNAFSHANMGWTCLDQGDHLKAREHFREALRLDPNLDYARAGLVEALKAKNILYRWLLGYFLWVAKLSTQAGWMLILGLFVAVRLLASIEESQPALAPIILPIILLYFVFVLLSWLGAPFFNLLLRLDTHGKYALSRDQIIGSNVFGIMLLVALAAWIGFAVVQSSLALRLAFGMTLLMLPASGIFVCQRGWPRNVMLAVTLGLAVLAVAPAWVPALYEAGALDFETARSLLEGTITAFSWGCFLSLLLANHLAQVMPRR